METSFPSIAEDGRSVRQKLHCAFGKLYTALRFDLSVERGMSSGTSSHDEPSAQYSRSLHFVSALICLVAGISICWGVFPELPRLISYSRQIASRIPVLAAGF